MSNKPTSRNPASAVARNWQMSMLESWVSFDLGSFSPLARPIKLRVLRPCARALSPKAHPSYPSNIILRMPVSLPVLPLHDLAEPVMLQLMRSCGASAARCAPTCKEFAAALQRVAQSFLEEGIVYWTGIKPPLKPPVFFDAVGSKEKDWDRAISLAHIVPGAVAEDVLRLLRAQWTTNFSVALAVQVAHQCLAGSYPTAISAMVRDRAPVMALPRLLDFVLGHSIRHGGGAASYAADHPSWHAQLAAAPYVVGAVNSSNAHWASLRVWKHGPAEVFDSMPGLTPTANVQIILDLLACFGWDSGKQIHFYSFEHYKQHDSYSCGLITAATVVSLLHGHQLGVARCDLALWKSYFTHSIYCANAGETPLVRAPHT